MSQDDTGRRGPRRRARCPRRDGAARTATARALAGLSLATLHAIAAAADNPAEAVEEQRVDVIGTTPLPGLGTPLKDVPANVQVFGSAAIKRQHAGNVTNFLEDNPTSVTTNAAQGNAYQPDISFRGFTASPLLGVPQGLSVFQDGVRINEPFGDVVNWDLLPQSAIASLQLIPGSNPIFGLNTLGGALSIYTKSGSTYPGTAVELSGGSFGRLTAEFEHGGYANDWDWFLTGNVSKEDGWAEHNPARVEQLFGKLGWQDEVTDLDLSLTGANNELQGTQTLPRSFTNTPREAYTWPDIDHDHLAMATLKGSRFLTKEVLLGGNAYVRSYRASAFSSDVNDDYGTQDPDTGEVDTVQALNDQSTIRQSSYGFGLQLTFSQPWGTHANQFVVGGGGDFADAAFTQESQDAQFTADRGTTAIGPFAPETHADTSQHILAAFLADTFTLSPEWSVTASGRFNSSHVSIRDESGEDPALDGDHTFNRFSPSIGGTYHPSDAFTAYASLNQGTRAPTAIELTCADPLAPCKLPNSFLADPALAQVIARTVELGARGQAAGWQWGAAAYRTRTDNDIQFISAGNAINAGYFRNVGRTQRQGIELNASGPLGPVHVDVRYSFLDATYQASFVEHSPNNASANEAGDIVVPVGAQVPGLPRQTLKLRVEGDLTATWQAGAHLLLNGPSWARGNENNADPSGRVAGYGIVNLDTSWHPRHGVELFLRVDNVFDRHYANFGILGENVFANPSRTFDPANSVSETFLGQGTPRGAWAGVRLSWD
jgi:outer membrane receptor protein involved in Fe transport